MRAAAFLLLLLALPTAAALIEAPARREAPLVPGGAQTFLVPVSTSGGALYAKILPTEGNAVHDGVRANGTLSPPTGWRVGFALQRADGARHDLGERVDSEPTTTADVLPGEAATLLATVHAPPEAQPPATVYVVVALSATGAPDGGSGARQDEARAITLVLTGAPRDTPAPGIVALALTLSLTLTLTLVRCRR